MLILPSAAGITQQKARAHPTKVEVRPVGRDGIRQITWGAI